MSSKETFAGCKIYGSTITEDITALFEAVSVVDWLLKILSKDNGLRWTKFGSNYIFLTGGKPRRTVLYIGFARKFIESYEELIQAEGWDILVKLSEVLHTIRDIKVDTLADTGIVINYGHNE